MAPAEEEDRPCDAPLSWRWWVALFAFRCVNAALLRTYFDPDEFWQGPEVSHAAVFGYGHLTWEWTTGLRGFAHPALFVLPLALLRAAGLDAPWAVVRTASQQLCSALWPTCMRQALAPRVMQAALQAEADMCVYALASRVYGPRTARWALLCQLCNWFTLYAGVRTLSNSAEMVFTVCALRWWPGFGATPCKPHPLRRALFCAAMACLIRPTSAVTWIALAPPLLWRSMRDRAVVRTVCEAVVVGAAALGAGALVDRWFYGVWCFPMLEFARFNMTRGLSTLYGTHPWHWYWTQGFPMVLGPFVPLLVLSWRDRAGRGLLLLTAWVLAVFSASPHKEFRFAFPVLPAALCVCGAWFARHYAPPQQQKQQQQQHRQDDDDDDDGTVQHAVLTRRRGRPQKPRPRTAALRPTAERRGRLPLPRLRGRPLAVALCAVSVAMALALGLWHQRGPVAVAEFLAADAAAAAAPLACAETFRGAYNGTPGVAAAAAADAACYDVLFLTPCHATPLQALIHAPGRLRILDCGPGARVDGTTEEDAFFRDPTAFLARLEGRWPARIVLFDALVPRVGAWLDAARYSVAFSAFHSLESPCPLGRVGRRMLVYSRALSTSASTVPPSTTA